MNIRPGARVLYFSIALVVASVLCFAIPPAAYLIPAGVLALLVLAFLDYNALRKSWENLKIERVLPPVAGRGVPFKVSMQISGAASLLKGEIRDVLPPASEPQYWSAAISILPAQATVVSTECQIPTRGLHGFGPIWLRLNGPYGILEAQRVFDQRSNIKVLPESAVSREGLDSQQLAVDLLERSARTRLRGQGLEFESLSEFREGDDVRRIDWRSSARHNRTVIRRYQLEQHRDVVIVLDCGRLMGTRAGNGTKLDRAVDSALMLSRVALEKGDRCGLGVFDDQVLGFLPPLSGAGAQKVIMDSVYNVQSRWRESNFNLMFATLQAKQSKRSLLVVLSDLVDAAASEQFRTALVALSRRHLLVFAALQTPLLDELAHAPTETMLDAARSSVALHLQREREKALHSLTHFGINVLDVDPAHLTVPLINRYVALRQQNLL